MSGQKGDTVSSDPPSGPKVSPAHRLSKGSLSSTALTVINQNQLAQGGAGINFKSRLFALQPATLTINQKNTQAEGAIPGKLRISETGDQFDYMDVTFLMTPEERRDFYIGERGTLNRSPENLMCFCRNITENFTGSPHLNSKVPQSPLCSVCKNASWEKWRQTKLKEDIPACELYYFALLMDTKYKLPLKFYVRSKSKDPFEKGCKELARKFRLMQSEGLKPNVFDIRFRLSTEKIQEGKYVWYVPKLSEFRAITDIEREEFGELYLELINQGRQQDDKRAELEAAKTIDAEVVEPGTETNVHEGQMEEISF